MMSISLRLVLAFLLTLALTILPMPEFMSGVRPPWVLLLVLYLQFYLPDYFNVRNLFIIGLILDVLLSTVLGEHAFALIIVTWLASTKARRFYFFSIGQQMALIGLLSFVYQLVMMLVDAFVSFHVSWVSVIGSSLLSILLWPWVRLLAEDTLLAKVRYQRTM
ncbi:rod shape-determining protein MreD [Legionella sp. CNM-4043-24]|uniref:rod shape-determining protein MreD n=1 Tax=Legionella sp. CNM-4043-24 TaxID=3421646 RepID=UPI00403B1C39